MAFICSVIIELILKTLIGNVHQIGQNQDRLGLKIDERTVSRESGLALLKSTLRLLKFQLQVLIRNIETAFWNVIMINSHSTHQ